MTLGPNAWERVYLLNSGEALVRRLAVGQTYQVTGINLKSTPLGETDRLVTVLTAEVGLLRAVAPAARKPKSRLRGRMEPFVVNQLLVVKGRSLDRIIQADTQHSYPGLSQHLAKLTAAQYWAEIALGIGLGGQPQVELYAALNASLVVLEGQTPQAADLLACLNGGTLQLLAVGGLAPQLTTCCRSGRPLVVGEKPDWRVGFSIEAGGAIAVTEAQPASRALAQPRPQAYLTATEWRALQQLTDLGAIAQAVAIPPLDTGRTLEGLLRRYTQHHLGRPIRSAAFIDTLFIDP